MVNNLKSQQPQDPKEVNIYEAGELPYWGAQFGVTPEALKHAVDAVGIHVHAVRWYLDTIQWYRVK